MVEGLKMAYMTPINQIETDMVGALTERMKDVFGETERATIEVWIRYGSTRQWQPNQLAEGSSLAPIINRR